MMGSPSSGSGRPPSSAAASGPGGAVGGRETILLLDDDPLVRRVTTRVLGGLGYTVLVAGTAAVALEIAKNHPTAIDLLLTDVVMPDASGRVTAKTIREVRPEIRVLFMSGFAQDRMPAGATGMHLSKPFTRNEIADKVREVMEAQPWSSD